MNSGRSDDNAEVIEKRLISYEKETIPVVNKLSEISHLVNINGNGQISEISKNIMNSIKYLI